ncbi:hypothetical protein ACROYT_G014421 [Oculina patagonica]
MDFRYKRSLITTMLDRAYRISSDLSYFSEECNRLETVFFKLNYPKQLFNLAVKQFVDSKVAYQQHIPSTDMTTPPIRVIIPFKDQVSVNVVKKRLTDLSSKIKTTIQPMFISRKLNEDLKIREVKPATVNQQCVVYKFQCNLCDAGYVGYSPAATSMNELMYTNKIPSFLNKETKTVSQWYQANLLQANPNKYQILVMAPQRGDKNAKDMCTLTIDNQQIRATRNLKILGINMDDEISFSDHVRNICKKASQKSGCGSKTL